MMLPDRPQTGASPPAESVPAAPTAKPVSAKPAAPRTDYNLQPLPVHGLGHYVEREESDRFQVD